MQVVPSSDPQCSLRAPLQPTGHAPRTGPTGGHSRQNDGPRRSDVWKVTYPGLVDMVVKMAGMDDHDRKIVIEFCHLLEKSKQLFNGLR